MPRPRGEIADRRVGLRVDPVGDETLKLSARGVDHTQGRVAGPGQRRRGLDDSLQKSIEGELGAERDAGFDEAL